MGDPHDTKEATVADRPRRLTRQRDCGPATSLDLATLDACGVFYEIVESNPQATVLQLRHEDLSRLARVLAGPAELEARLEYAQGEVRRLRRQLGGTAA